MWLLPLEVWGGCSSGVKWGHPNRENERAMWEGVEGRKEKREMM